MRDCSLEVIVELPVSLLSDYVMFKENVFSNKLKSHLLQHVLAARIFVDSIGKHYAHLQLLESIVEQQLFGSCTDTLVFDRIILQMNRQFTLPIFEVDMFENDFSNWLATAHDEKISAVSGNFFAW